MRNLKDIYQIKIICRIKVTMMILELMMRMETMVISQFCPIFSISHRKCWKGMTNSFIYSKYIGVQARTPCTFLGLTFWGPKVSKNLELVWFYPKHASQRPNDNKLTINDNAYKRVRRALLTRAILTFFPGGGGLHFMKWFHKKIFNFTKDGFPKDAVVKCNTNCHRLKIQKSTVCSSTKYLFCCRLHRFWLACTRYSVPFAIALVATAS